MRSIPISMAIFGFCVTAPVFGCFWSWFITLQYSVKTLNFTTWFIFNSIFYIGVAVFYHLYTIRLNNRKWESTVYRSVTIVGIVLVISTIISVYEAYRVAIWTLNFTNPELAGFDVMALMLMGIFNGVLTGLVILTLGYHWIPKDERKQKV